MQQWVVQEGAVQEVLVQEVLVQGGGAGRWYGGWCRRQDASARVATDEA